MALISPMHLNNSVISTPELVSCTEQLHLRKFSLALLIYNKGKHTVSFSTGISLYNVNQMPMSPRTNFYCGTKRSSCFSA